MADSNKQIVEKAFKGYAQHIEKVTFGELDKYCKDVLRKAVWERLHVAFGHNYTGNLINSIVVCMYRKSTGRKYDYFAYNSVKLPIRRELSALNTRGKYRRNNINFGPGSKFGREDWTGQWSTLRAENLVPTDESWGQNDAINFANTWIPSNPDLSFVICVAYTSEYASYVEEHRKTTGYLGTLDYAERMAIEYYHLKPAA